MRRSLLHHNVQELITCRRLFDHDQIAFHLEFLLLQAIVITMFRKSQLTIPMRTPWRLLLAVLCIGLVALCGTLAVVHSHPLGDVSHADCGLCIAGHTVVYTTALPVQASVAHVVSVVAAALPVARPRTLSRFALFTRPPPVDAQLS